MSARNISKNTTDTVNMLYKERKQQNLKQQQEPLQVLTEISDYLSKQETPQNEERSNQELSSEREIEKILQKYEDTLCIPQTLQIQPQQLEYPETQDIEFEQKETPKSNIQNNMSDKQFHTPDEKYTESDNFYSKDPSTFNDPSQVKSSHFQSFKQSQNESD